MEYVVLVLDSPVAFCHTEEEANAIADIYEKHFIGPKRYFVKVFCNVDQNGRIKY